MAAGSLASMEDRMRGRKARSALLGLVFTLALAAPARAQQPSRPLSGGNEQAMLVGLGISFLNAGDQTGFGIGANALFNALTMTELGRIGIVGDFGVNWFDGATITTVGGGARLTFTTSGKYSPYGQFLLGIAHCCGETEFGPAIGFGIDIAWKPEFNFRGEVQFNFAGPGDSTRWFFGASLPISK
jgi:hypothetical protein